FYPPAEYLNTTRITEVEGEKFSTEGKILKNPGFKEVYGKDADSEETIPPIGKDGKAKTLAIDVSDETTNPPPRYTESTLLSMMENAGKLVEDDEFADAMKDRGMGTPATRAAIIEKLISDKYMVRDGKELVPTSKAFDLIHVAKAMQIEDLTSPELTGEWEYKLAQIEKGKETRAEFMNGIEKLTTRMVKNIKGFKEEDTRKEAAFSPVNGEKVYESVSRFDTDSGIQIRKILGGRKMSDDEIVELLTKKKIGPLTGFRSKRGMEFSAGLILDDKNKIKFVFDNSDSEDIELGEQIGVSPIDKSPVFDTLTAYISQSSLDKAKTGFRLNKVILGKEIGLNNVKKMLAGEKTDLIQGFRSSKTHRLFDAYLLLDKSTGKIKFDFPPREAKAGGRRFFKKKAAGTSEE
ncbi:MAG: DNA topoisomerase, partial [Fibrobacteraceae bacterium]